jgi:hypothetical protein
MQLFGMAGFAEGLWAQMIVELYIGTLVVAVLTLLAFMQQSRAFAVAALLTNVVVALLYLPWEAFLAASSDDTDWQSLLSAWRTAATWWVGISVAAGTITLWLFARNSRCFHKPLDVNSNQPLQQTAT